MSGIRLQVCGVCERWYVYIEDCPYCKLAAAEALVTEAREHDPDVYWLSRDWHKRAAKQQSEGGMSNCKTCGCDFPQHLQMCEQIEALKKELAEAIDRERCEVVRRKFDVAENKQLTARLAEAEAERDLESSDRVAAEFEMLALRDRLSESEAEIKRLNQVLNNSLAGIEDAYSGGSEQAAKGVRDE